MWSYRLNFMPAIKISVIWSGIEALFMIDHNIKNTIATVSSRFIYGNDDKIEDIKNLYKEARCKALFLKLHFSCHPYKLEFVA